MRFKVILEIEAEDRNDLQYFLRQIKNVGEIEVKSTKKIDEESE